MNQRPNLLVFLTDDHAQWAARCYGDPVVDTPHFDRLARDGVRCTSAYTPSPVCSPARACFFTGLLPSQHGIHDYLDERLPGVPTLAGAGLTNLAQRLQAAGYRTGLVGKWHCGDSHLPQPGFDTWFSYRHGQYPHRGPQTFVDGEREVHWDGFQSDHLRDRALDFIRADDGRPWFLFVGLVNTHSPFVQQPEELVARYRARLAPERVPAGLDAPPAAGWVRFGVPPEPEVARDWLAQYYAAVTAIDEVVGVVSGAAPAADTLVVYTSDHGHMNGQHGLYTKGNATVPQNFYEESVAIPLILSLPGALPAGRVHDGFIDHLDLHQTLLEAAGLPAPAESPGVSQWAALRAPATSPSPDKNEAASKPYQLFEYGNARAARDARWKYIRRLPPIIDGLEEELYDLAADPAETLNLAATAAAPLTAEAAAARARLAAEIEVYFARHESPRFSPHRLFEQPRCNQFEPWCLKRPAETPLHGSELAALGYRNDAPSLGTRGAALATAAR